MAETLSIMSIISFIIAGVSFAIALFCWFYFKIPTVISDLTGRTAKKSIEKMRETNEKNGIKSYRPSSVNIERGKLTDNIQDTNKIKNVGKKLDDKKDSKMSIPETDLLADNRAKAITYEQTTTLLSGDDETELLEITKNIPTPTRASKTKLIMLEDIMLIHTEEVIE